MVGNLDTVRGRNDSNDLDAMAGAVDYQVVRPQAPLMTSIALHVVFRDRHTLCLCSSEKISFLLA